jgi:hypothetical protein
MVVVVVVVVVGLNWLKVCKATIFGLESQSRVMHRLDLNDGLVKYSEHLKTRLVQISNGSKLSQS